MDLERGRKYYRRGRHPFLPSNRSLLAGGIATAANIAYGIRNASRIPSPGTSPSTSRSPKRMRYASRSRSRSRGRTMRRGTARRRSRARSGARSASITTEQRDSSIRYVRRGGRRRGNSFARRVSAVINRLGACQTFSMRTGGYKTVTVNQQTWEGQFLGGTQPTANDEIYQAFREAYGTTFTIANGDSYRLFIKHLCLDIQITNNGDKNLIIEMYTIKYRKAWTAGDRLAAQLTTCIGEIDTPTGFTFTSTDPGYTLFQVPQFCQYWTVVKKQQIVLSANETTTLQIRIPFNKMVNGKYLETNAQALSFARGFIWSAKGAPEANGALDGAQYSDGSYVWTSQTTVNYQMPPSNSIQRSATQL